MNSKTKKASRRHISLGFGVSLLLAAGLLLPGIGSFGMWEPHEAARADLAHNIAKNAPLPSKVSTGFHLEERLVAWSWSLGGQSELVARLPKVILGIMAVAALFLLILPLGGVRTASYAAFVLASAPVLLFHGRQLTSFMPLLLGETLAVGGLALFAYGRGTKAIVFGGLAAIVGLILGWMSSGILMGVAAPSATVVLALALNGDVASIFQTTDKSPNRQREIVTFIAGAMAILSTAGFFLIAWFSESDIPLLTGGIASAALKPKTYDFVLEQIAYGWFPWSALAPIAIIGFFAAKTPQNKTDGMLRSLVFAGVAVGYIAQLFFISTHGVSPCFFVVPLTLGVALAIGDLENQKVPQRVGAVFALALLIIMVRDFAQRPETILMGYGFEKIPLPKDFTPIKMAAIFSAPFGLLIIMLGFIGAGVDRQPRWRSWRSLILVPLAAASFGGYVTFALVPNLSMHLSPKYALESYKQFRKGNEPLGVYGSGRFLVNATKLTNRNDVIEWLNRKDRVFVLFPPKELAYFDRQFRKTSGRHISILDAKSDRFMLATSKLKSNEKDKNPIVPFVSSKPFDLPPQHRLEVNFENKLTLLGWDVKSENNKPYLVRGKDFTVTTYWRCDEELKTDYKFFMHIDGPGGRIHGDHKPVQDKYSTRKWEKGDYIKDVYTRQTPLYQKKGRYTIRAGLYKGSKRLKVLDYPKARENAVPITTLDLR